MFAKKSQKFDQVLSNFSQGKKVAKSPKRVKEVKSVHDGDSTPEHVSQIKTPDRRKTNSPTLQRTISSQPEMTIKRNDNKDKT